MSDWQTDSGSESGSGSDSGELDPVEAANLVKHEPMYYVLNRFLETVDNKNVATCINELTTELRELKLVIAQLIKAYPHPSPSAQVAPAPEVASP